MKYTDDEIRAAIDTLDRLRDAFTGGRSQMPASRAVREALRVVSSVLGYPTDPPFPQADGVVTSAMAQAWGVLGDKARRTLAAKDQAELDHEELEAETVQVRAGRVQPHMPDQAPGQPTRPPEGDADPTAPTPTIKRKM